MKCLDSIFIRLIVQFQ